MCMEQYKPYTPKTAAQAFRRINEAANDNSSPVLEQRVNILNTLVSEQERHIRRLQNELLELRNFVNAKFKL